MKKLTNNIEIMLEELVANVKSYVPTILSKATMTNYARCQYMVGAQLDKYYNVDIDPTDASSIDSAVEYAKYHLLILAFRTLKDDSFSIKKQKAILLSENLIRLFPL